MVWYISLVTTFMMFFRLRIWIEHQGVADTHKLKFNRLQAAIIAPHKVWLHFEHHRFPAIPYHRLDAARDICAGESAPIGLGELIGVLEKSAFHPSGIPMSDASGF